jgi:hypothetical protein
VIEVAGWTPCMLKEYYNGEFLKLFLSNDKLNAKETA